MKPLRYVSLLVLLILPSLVAAAPVVTVRSGHSAAIRDLTMDDTASFLFSGGDDGKLLVWDAQSERLLQSIHADILPLQQIAPYPDGERVAVYASDGQTNRITVWNWRTGERNFLHTPADQVLHMDVSSEGSYLLYSVPRLRSVRILDGGSGRELPFLRENTGIVTWFAIARSEERVMTYSPGTGEIVYRAIVTGREAASFTGPTDLSDLALLTSPRFAAARTADGALAVIDLLSGAVVAETVAGEIQHLQVDRSDSDIVTVSLGFGGESTVRRFGFSEVGTGDSQSWELQRRYTTRREVPSDMTVFYHHNRDIFAGRDDGALLRWLPFEVRPQTLAESTIAPAGDLLIRGSTLHLLGTNQILSITSDFFDAGRVAEDTSYVRDRYMRLATAKEGRFVSDDLYTDLIWTPEADDEVLRDFEPTRGRITDSPIDPPEAPISVDLQNRQLLFLNRSGLIALHDTRTGEQTFTYRGRGLQTAILTSRGIFVGKAAEGVLDSSVFRVDPRTGETVSIETSTDLVFFLEYDARRGRLFTIGVRDRGDEGPATVIEVLEGAAFQRRRTILEIDGEYLDSMLIIDPVTGNAYTTLDDRGGILRWDSSRVSELVRNPSHIPKEIALNGDYLYAVNRDGTVSILDRYAGEGILDIYMINGAGSGSWVATRSDGTFIASRDALATPRFFSLVDERFRTLDQLRLHIPSRAPTTSPEPTVPRNRFDSGTDPDDEQPEEFDPFGGGPAPSS